MVRIDGPKLVTGYQATIRYDPSRLVFLGQPAPSAPFAIVQEAGDHLRLAVLDPAGLNGLPVVLAFAARGGPVDGLALRIDVATGPDLDLVPIPPAIVATDGTASASGLSARPRSLADWSAWAAGPAGGRRPLAVPGQGAIYGDAVPDGILTIVDAFGVANQSVGNLPLITDPTKDYVIAANVFPFNTPGLGEFADPVAPGVEPDGSRVITIVDAVAIANETVGNNQPIVGEPIPGRGTSLDRVVITGDIAEDRVFRQDSVYELDGLVRVLAGVTLTIEPGTRVEGRTASRGTLMVVRGGVLEAEGTVLEPIVMSCTDVSPAPGCWGGVVMNGLSLLNNDNTSPGGGLPVCPEKQTIGSNDVYGGCLVEHSSGRLRYLRIEHAGMPAAGGGATPGLALLGVGSGTDVDNVQVHRSSGQGLFVSGGTVDLRRVLATGNGAAALAWDDGWTGHTQFLIVQQPDNAGPGLQGSNWAGNPDAGPRSHPTIYHATLIGSPGDGLPTPGVLLMAGSALTLRNSIVLGFSGAGLDIEEQATCDLVAATPPGIDVSNSFFFQNTEPFASDVDCVDEVAFGSDGSRANWLTDPGLIAPFNRLTLDARPAHGAASAGGAPAPTGGGTFFDALALFYGAVGPASQTGSTIPWFTGWSVGW